MLDNLVTVQERNKRKRKQATSRTALKQWLLECEDYEEIQLFEPLKNKRTKFAPQDKDYRDNVPRSTKRNFNRNPLRIEKLARDE
jgi:hypothetical protein